MTRLAKPICAVVLAVALATGLTGCGGTPDKAATKGQAGGQILPASTSDEMLPLDTVRSQPPLAPKSDASPAAKASGSAAAKPKAAAPVIPSPSDSSPSEPVAPPPTEAE